MIAYDAERSYEFSLSTMQKEYMGNRGKQAYRAVEAKVRDQIKFPTYELTVWINLGIKHTR